MCSCPIEGVGCWPSVPEAGEKENSWVDCSGRLSVAVKPAPLVGDPPMYPEAVSSGLVSCAELPAEVGANENFALGAV